MKCLSCLRSPCSWMPKRYLIAIYILIGLNIYYWIRVSVILALAQMTFPLAKNKTIGANHEYCPPSEKLESSNRTKAEFHWDTGTQHLILQGYYYGFLAANVPGGMLADTFGGKPVFAFGFLVATIIAIVTPTLAKFSPYCFFVGRIVQGLGQGVVFPSMSSIVAKWAPPNERATMTGIIQSGVMFGNASGFIVSSFILANMPEWEGVFYINGALGLTWLFGFYILCYSSPAQHPFVSDKERNMIESQIAQNTKPKPKHIPWKKILTSAPLFSAVLANGGHVWANVTMVNEMPLYLSKVINFDIQKSGIFSATPHLAMVPTAMGTGYLCDWLVRKGFMSITVNRKIFIFLSNALPVPFLIAASVAGCNKVWVVILFAVMMFFKGLAYPTLKAQPVDLSPHYAGILMGIINGTGSISGFVSPMLVPLFITGDGSIQEWRGFFALSGGIMIALTFPFLCIGSGNVQPWNSENLEEAEEEGGKEEQPEQGKEQKPE